MTFEDTADLPAKPPSRVVGRVLRYVAIVAVAAVLWINLSKTLWAGIQGWGRPYWWLDYHHGFVRRGLVGEVFQAIFGRLSETQLTVPVGWEQRACLVVLAVAMLIQLNAAMRAQATGKRAALVLVVGLWAAVSQFWPTVAYTQGYLDALVLAIAAVAALLMRARLYWAVGLCLAIGPFIHEYFCFLVPFVLACDRIVDDETEGPSSTDLVSLDVAPSRSPLPRHLLWLAGVAVLAAAVVILLPAAAATRQEIAAMPLSPENRSVLLTVTLTQSLQQSLGTCLALFFRNPLFTLKNIVFFSGPALLATGGLLLWTGGRASRGSSRGIWLRAAAGLFPIAALALAWDLSRLLVMADFTAVMLFLMTTQDIAVERDRGAPALPWAGFLGAGAAGLAALGYLILPMAYVYYPPGPVSLVPLNEPLGFGPHTFGMKALWPMMQIQSLPRSLPADQKRPGPQLLHDLLSIPAVSRPGFLGWRIAPRPEEALVLYGPYIDLKGGVYRAIFHLRPQSGSAACTPPTARIEGTTAGDRKPATSPTRVEAEAGCSWSVSAELTVPEGGSPAVETHLFLKAPAAVLVDRYTLEPVAAQSR